MNEEADVPTRDAPRGMSEGQPRVLVADGIVYLAPWGYTPLGKNNIGEMLATNGDEMYVMPRVGQQVTGGE